MLKAQHYVKPDIYPFYDLEHGMKKGGKRRRAKRKSTRKSHSKPITNQNIIKINIGGAYEKMNKRKQFQAPRRIMANAPKALKTPSMQFPIQRAISVCRHLVLFQPRWTEFPLTL